MKDLITYIADLNAFRIEAANIVASKSTAEPHVAADLFYIDDNSNIKFKPSQRPPVSNENKTLNLVRVQSKEALQSITTLQIIGECINNSYVFIDDGQDIYEANYSTNPRMIDDGQGGEIEYTPPYKFGVFY